MLTGDNEKTAARVAQSAGITEFRADLLPEDKHGFVEQLKAEGCKVVMVGDAMGDAQAAAANGVSFVPILPGREAESWRRLQEEALPKLLHGTFSPEYQATLLAQLRSVLHG